MAKKTVSLFQKLKNNNEKIAMLTAYDYSTAKIINEADIDGINRSFSYIFSAEIPPLPPTFPQYIVVGVTFAPQECKNSP